MMSDYPRAGEPFWERVPKFSMNFEEILSCAFGDFEEQNKVFEHSILLLLFLIIVLLLIMHVIIIIVE